MGRLLIAADAFHVGHETKSILAENLLHVTFCVSFLQQGFGDFRKLRGVFHAEGHVGAVEIGADADVVDAGDFYGVVDVLDDFGPFDAREFARSTNSRVMRSPSMSWQPSLLPQRFWTSGRWLVDFGIGRLSVAEFLAEKADVELIWMTPSFAASSRIISSVMLRG